MTETTPRSALVYKESAPPRPTVAPVIVLGVSPVFSFTEGVGTLDESHALGERLLGGRAVTAEGLVGIYEGAWDLWAHGWFYDAPDIPYPEPASFAYNLQHVEQFVYDLHDRISDNEPAPVLVGQGQGASLGIWLAQLIPDYLTAVVSHDGIYPQFPGIEPDPRPLDGLPVLLLRQHVTGEQIETTAAQLRGRGAEVAVQEVTGDLLAQQTEAVIKQWLTAVL